MDRRDHDAGPLLEGFSSPNREDWSAAVQRELRGRSEESLDWQPDPGLLAAPLHTREDTVDLPHLHPDVARVMRPRAPFRIRQLVDAAEPSLAARICAAAIERGADELLLRLDRLARHGVDPGTLTDTGTDSESDDETELFATETGQDGCAIYHADALGQVLADIDVAATDLAFDAGAATLPILGMLLHIAKERGVAGESLRVELGFDPVREIVRGSARAASTVSLVDECVAAFDATSDFPHVIPIAAASSAFHEAGASAAQEVGCTLATALTYLRTLVEAGRDVDAAAHAICLRLTVGTDIYAEIAKLRAARLLWAKVAAAFGARDPRIRIGVESSTRSFGSDDVETNLIRTGIQSFASTLSCVDSIAIAPFDLNHDDRDLDAQSLARNQLILLREESMMQRVEDPCRGSYTIETLTDGLARNAWAILQDLEKRGGILAAIEEGHVQRSLAETAGIRSEEIRDRSRVLVGGTRFVDGRFRKQETSLPDADLLQHQVFEYLAAREAQDPPADTPAETPAEIYVAIDDAGSLQAAAAAGCTVGEVSRAIRGSETLSLDHPFLEFSTDAAPFEVLRSMLRAAPITVQPVVIGEPRVARARLSFSQDFFSAGGFTLLDPIHRDSIETVEDVTTTAPITVLCGDDATVDTVFARVRPDTPATGGLVLAIAGRPRPATELADAFLFEGCDALRTLRNLYFEVATGDDS